MPGAANCSITRYYQGIAAMKYTVRYMNIEIVEAIYRIKMTVSHDDCFLCFNSCKVNDD